MWEKGMHHVRRVGMSTSLYAHAARRSRLVRTHVIHGAAEAGFRNGCPAEEVAHRLLGRL